MPCPMESKPVYCQHNILYPHPQVPDPMEYIWAALTESPVPTAHISTSRAGGQACQLVSGVPWHRVEGRRRGYRSPKDASCFFFL